MSVISEISSVQFAGLAARTTNYSAFGFVLAGQPTTHNVGYVTNDKSFSAFLWNGTADDVTLTDITYTDADGVTCDATPPDIIPAVSSQRINITVGIDGPLEFAAMLTFLSACTADPILIITGTRAPHLSGDVGALFMPHNWEDGFNESMAWKTDVLIAHDRTEQRIQLRTMPRRSWDLRLLVSGPARRKLETWLGLRRARYLFAPIWRDAVRLAAPIAIDDTTITIAEVSDNFADGTPVAVWTDWQTFEIRTITGAGSNYLAVDAPFLSAWPAGSAMIAPCRYCLGMDQRRVSRFTEVVGDYRLTLRATDDQWEPSGAEPDTYQALPICPFVPSWSDDEETWDNKWVELDNDTGLVEFDIQSDEPVLSRSAHFLIIGRDRINTLLVFLKLRAGRLAPFWIAANDRGFELAAPAAADTNLLTISSIDYEYALQGSAAREHIELITAAGLTIRRKITAVQTLPSGDEQFTLDSPLPVDVSASTLNRCAWLELVRLDTDEITLHWISGDCLETTLPIVVLP